jgi:hypothetical protein
MKPTLELNTNRFNAMTRQLARATGIELRVVMRNEAAKVLDKCIEKTKIATLGKIEKSSIMAARGRVNAAGHQWLTKEGLLWIHSERTGKDRVGGQITLSSGNGQVIPNRHGRRLGQSMLARAANAISLYASALAQERPARIAARGLAVQSWVQAADAIQLDIVTTNKVIIARKAVARNGIYYRNGNAAEREQGKAHVITLTNTLPYNDKIRMGAILRAAIGGRVGYMRNNVNNGVFKSMSSIAAAYPGLRASLN